MLDPIEQAKWDIKAALHGLEDPGDLPKAMALLRLAISELAKLGGGAWLSQDGQEIDELRMATTEMRKQIAGLKARSRAVVWARYDSGGDEAWERLKAAIGRLEDIVGRPPDEGDL